MKINQIVLILNIACSMALTHSLIMGHYVWSVLFVIFLAFNSKFLYDALAVEDGK